MSSLKDYVENMMESQVVAEDEVGDLYTGTLKKFSTSGQLEVELSSAVKFSAASENEKTVKKFENNIILKAKRIVGDGTKTVTERVFLTDSKIASNKTNQNGGNEHFNESDTELDLQAWEDDGSGEYATNDYESGVTDDLDNLGGWSVADMFHANKDKCVGNGTVFDESEFSNVGIGEYSKEELEKAQAIAQQIAMNPASRHNAQLENDDEERDLDAATKFDANEKSQRGSGKMNDEIKQQRQVLEKVSISASKIPSTNNRNEEKYVKKMTTSEKKTFPQKVTTTELNDTQKMTNKKFEKEKKVENVDVSPPPEPLPPQIAKASTPVPNRKYSGGGGRKSADKAVLVQNSEQGDKVERIFKLDLNALPFVPSAKSATKGAKSATIVNSNVTAVSSAPTPMMSGSLVVYNNTATPVTNNLVTVANNFGNNFMANQMIPIPTATLQPFQYAQIQHTHIPQAQPPLSHQQLPAHVLSRSPPVQPQQQQHIQQAMMPATLHQTQHAAFQQQQQVAGFYAAAGAEGTNLSAYVLNWGAANANNFGNNFMANQMIPVPTATLQPFQYAQIQAPIPQTQPQLSHQQLPAHVLSRSPSVQPQQQQHVQQAMMPATLHQTQHAAFQQQQQVAGFYAAAGAEGTNLSAYVLNWGAANANNFGNNFMANQMIPVPTATLQPFQQQQPH